MQKGRRKGELPRTNGSSNFCIFCIIKWNLTLCLAPPNTQRARLLAFLCTYQQPNVLTSYCYFRANVGFLPFGKLMAHLLTYFRMLVCSLCGIFITFFTYLFSMVFFFSWKLQRTCKKTLKHFLC